MFHDLCHQKLKRIIKKINFAYKNKKIQKKKKGKEKNRRDGVIIPRIPKVAL